ncbi:MAG: rhodanese-like domain-containing protein [Thermoplasmata archaeon]
MAGEITPREAAERIVERPESIVLLDVREDIERATATIDGSIHIPMGQIPGRIHEIPRDRDLIVYCHHGSRSMMVAEYLEGEGFDRVLNLTGGIDAWSVRVDPKVPRYG